MSHSAFEQPIPQISVEELASRIADADADLQLIDVREPDELTLASVAGFTNLPLSQFANWSETIQTRLNPTAETIVMCHHGMRSQQMCYWLLQQGFTHVKNVSGGIDAYSAVVDPTVPRY